MRLLMVEEPCFLRTKKERIHKSSSYSIAFSFQKSKPFFQFFSCFFSLSPRYPKTSTSRILSSVSNTLWAPRVSFEIRHLRRLRLERSRESLSRSWWLAQSYPAHVAPPGNREPFRVRFRKNQVSLTKAPPVHKSISRFSPNPDKDP